MKRILIFLPYVPYPLRRGAYQRVYHLTQELASHFEVDLFCLSSEAEDKYHQPRFEEFCKRVRFEPFQHPPWPPFWTDRLWDMVPTTVRHWWSDEVLQNFHDFASGHDYDSVVFCDLVLWPYVKSVFPDHPCRVMDRSRVDWLFQTEVITTTKPEPLEKMKLKENIWKISKLEKEVRKELALMVVCGPDDQAFLDGKLGPSKNIFVLANGANVDFFNAEKWPQQPTAIPTALFCGALDYAPNTDGLAWYFERIHPLVRKKRPDFTIMLVGKSPTPEVAAYGNLEGVEFVGEVPDVRPYYQKAWMQVVPLRIGGGTRLKIAEGLSMANPVVSTTLGAQGLELYHDEHLLLADSSELFAEAMLRYIEDPGLRLQQGLNGRKKILETYTWQALGNLLAEQLNQLSNSES